MSTTSEISYIETIIDLLLDVLSNIEVMPDAMGISELDGYVAGLLLCPEMIMPSEWLPEVWNMDSEPEFISVAQAQDTIGAVMAHYNRVAGNLAQRSQAYEILLEQAEGEDTPFGSFGFPALNRPCAFAQMHGKPMRPAMSMMPQPHLP